MPAATLDVQLRERLLQRCLNGRDLLSGVIFFHSRFGAFDCRFGRGRVDLLGFKRHVGQNRNRVRFDFHKTFADREQCFASVFQDTQLAGFDCGQNRNVPRINAELAFRSRQHDKIDILRVGGRFRRNDFKAKRHYDLLFSSVAVTVSMLPFM